MTKTKFDITSSNEFYKQLLKDNGYNNKALGVNEKQLLRFHQLTACWNLSNKKILDVGSGFGDFNRYLQLAGVTQCDYTGIESVYEFYCESKKRYIADNIRFINDEFMNLNITSRYDYIIASGIFNLKIDGIDHYEYIYENLKKMFDLADIAISVDFLSDRVEYTHPWNYNSSPLKILELAYRLSRNVVIRNDYFPFEFSITINKEELFNKKTTTYWHIENEFKSLITE